MNYSQSRQRRASARTTRKRFARRSGFSLLASSCRRPSLCTVDSRGVRVRCLLLNSCRLICPVEGNGGAGCNGSKADAYECEISAGFGGGGNSRFARFYMVNIFVFY